MKHQEAIDYVCALAREHRERDVDLVLERSEQLSLRVFKGRVEKLDQATAQGLGIRVVQDGRTGLAYSERLAPESLDKAFAAARENAALQDPTEVILPEAPPAVPDPAALALYNPELDALEVDDLAALGLEIESRALQADKRVSAVNRLAVYRSSSEHRVVSLHGVDYVQRQNSVGAMCQALLQDGGRRKSGGHYWARRRWDPETAAKVGEEAVSRGAGLLGAESITGGRMPVVLDEYCAPQLLSLFFGAFSAEAAQKGQSRLKGKLGEQIAGEDITLTSEPHRPGAGGSRYLDAEGVPTTDMPLIEAGTFANFAYHVESARKEGRESNGHAGRGYSGGVGTTLHNVVMPSGGHDLEALIGLPERCLLVTELEGAAGCSPLSGDISIGVQGYWVEQGRRVHPVDGVTIAGNYFELLKAIRARGDAYQPNLSRLFIPALLVDGLSVSS